MADELPPNGVVLDIRKYPNRRYYDSTRSRHLTLEEIHAAIREGYHIRVIDSKSEDDITAKVLAQIIIELDPPKLEVFPVGLLHGILRSNQQIIGEFIQRYFNQPLAAFINSQRNLEQYMRSAMGIPGGPTMADWTRMMWGAVTPSGGGTGPAPASGAAAASTAPPVPEPPPADGEKLRRTVETLTRQVAQLHEKLGKSPAKPARKKRRPGR